SQSQLAVQLPCGYRGQLWTDAQLDPRYGEHWGPCRPYRALFPKGAHSEHRRILESLGIRVRWRAGDRIAENTRKRLVELAQWQAFFKDGRRPDTASIQSECSRKPSKHFHSPIWELPIHAASYRFAGFGFDWNRLREFFAGPGQQRYCRPTFRFEK